MYRFVFATIAALLFALPAQAAESFVEGLEDLPLMAGLEQMADDGVRFDTPAGRIVEVVVQANGTPAKKIAAFYARTLPQLGWQQHKTTAAPVIARFSREGEELTIEPVGNDHPDTYRFRALMP